MWKKSVHAQGVEVDSQLATFIDQQLRAALGVLGRRLVHVHVRLYRDTEGPGGCTCYIRVDLSLAEGIARGDAAGDVHGAVAGASARIRAAALEWISSPSTAVCVRGVP